MPGFRFRNSPPIRLFARLEQGCLPLGAALHRGTPPGAVHAGPAEPEFREPLSRELPDVVRPDSAPGAVPPVDWLDQVAADPIGALESFALGWFPAEEATGNAAAGDDEAAAVTGELPPAPAAFHRLARLRPALHRFHDPVLKQPEHTGDRLVLARWARGYRDRSIPWRRRERDGSGPVVWETEDPRSAYRETAVGQEPLSLLVRTPATATGGTLPSGLGCPPPAPDALSGPGPGQGDQARQGGGVAGGRGGGHGEARSRGGRGRGGRGGGGEAGDGGDRVDGAAAVLGVGLSCPRRDPGASPGRGHGGPRRRRRRPGR